MYIWTLDIEGMEVVVVIYNFTWDLFGPHLELDSNPRE